MKPYRCTVGTGILYCLVLITLLVNGAAAAGSKRLASTKSPATVPRLASTPLAHTGFAHFYNMEYDKAIHDFELDARTHPDDPFAANHVLTAVLFKELYRTGALDTELYAGDSFLSSRPLPVDSQVRQRIRELADHALLLSERRLQANPNDIDALYARGVTKGTRATAMALMDKAWFSALRSAIGARHDHERVLELDAAYTDAKLVVGMHNYVLGSLSWAVKVAASVAGLSGNRRKGLQYLWEAADGGGEASVDAKIVLSLFLRREQRYDEAIKIVGGLVGTYPHNFLVALEYANLLKAAGHGPEAIAAYRKLLAGGREGLYSEPRLEQVSWGLGEALRGQKEFQGAADAYESVVGFPKAQPELQYRANLAAGQMYDVLQQRELAVIKYQQVIATAGDSPTASQARRYLKQAYHLPSS
jgi:hypothetical protein